MTTAVRQPPHHRTLTCYTDYRCRLPECVARFNAYDRTRRRAQAAGTWQPLVDAEPIRKHLLALHAAGITIHRVATLTGLTDTAIRSFTQHASAKNRRRHRATHETAAKILAISLDTATPGYVDATGTRRRLHALVAIGWPLEVVATYVGVSQRNIWSLTQRNKVRATTARNVADVYGELCNEKPTRNGVSKWHAKQARNRASARRWPTPTYWDETGGIDDPDFIPDYKVTQAEILAEEAHWLITTAGLTRGQVAERLGKHRSYIDRVLVDHPQNNEPTAA